MDKLNGKVVLLTGASSGIGKYVAEVLAEKGCRVYGTSRKAVVDSRTAAEDETSDGKGFLKMLQLDVCSDESAQSAVNHILDKEGQIDILINNAGFGIAGSVEDTSPEEASRQMDTNFFGVHRMCRLVLPSMRNRGCGIIVNISSVAGLISIPYQSMYSASKYATEALTEALRIEVKPFGINVAIVEPGDTRTGFTDSRLFTAASENSVYKSRFLKAISTMIKDEKNGPGPELVAKAIIKVLKAKNPPVRITVGMQYKLLIFAKRLLPVRFVVYVVSKIY